MTKNDGGPAYPAKRPEVVRKLVGLKIGATVDEEIYEKVTELVDFPGMSLRDWFAGQALAGIFAHPDNWGLTPETMAPVVYAAADAMLAARKGGPDDA